MNVFVMKSLALSPVCEMEIARYAGVLGEDKNTFLLMREVIAEAEPLLSPCVAYTVLNCEKCADVCDFGSFSVNSSSLARSFAEANKVVLFCATIGFKIDRLLTKYNRLSPSKALMLSAFGTERTEALCDSFVSEYSRINDVKIGTRFSPGYGDLTLETQVDIFKILMPEKTLGVTLSQSLLMTPTKSVTAFAPIIS